MATKPHHGEGKALSLGKGLLMQYPGGEKRVASKRVRKRKIFTEKVLQFSGEEKAGLAGFRKEKPSKAKAKK
jgi:hypothetical protein